METIDRPKIRLLYCYDCKTLETIPDFKGRPDDDYVLEYTMSKHETNQQRHRGKLFDVEQRVWALQNLRQSIIEQIKGGSKGLAAFDPTFYDTRDTLKEDAAKCFQQHQRPKEGCLDWREDRKLLVPPTKAERKEVGLTMAGAPKRWLCDFCVVRGYYERKNRGD